MTILAFTDGDGYYQIDLAEGAPLPAWTNGLTPTQVMPPPTHEEIVASVMLGMKAQRLEIFRGMDTLQVDALTAGDQPRAEAIMQAKTALTALNNIDLSGYETAEEMQAAIQLAYYAIVMQAPQDVQADFQALVPR